MGITEKHISHFKTMNRIYHSHEDEMIKTLLNQSYEFLRSKAGPFSMDTEPRGAELVYNRARYAFNDSVEYFDEHFMSMVINFSLQNLDFSEADADETII